MNISPFKVEEWMNAYETQAKINIAETCVNSVSLDELFELTGENRQAFLDAFCRRRLTYGDIVGKPELREGICDLFKTLNPDECVALGAAVQGGRLGGEGLAAGGQDLLLMDVTPLTLSIETVGGVATHLIDRNSTIPTRYSKIFTTAAPFQSTVEIKVLQGEREFAKDNKLIGNFTLKGIKRAWAGVPQIEVTFDIDANGIVTVSARDLGTGKQQSITITGSSNLSEQEIRRAMDDAAAFAGQDQERKAAIEALNAAEAAIYRANSALGSKEGKALDKDTKNRIKEAEKNLERLTRHKKPEKMTPQDTQALNAAREALQAQTKDLVARWEATREK